MSTDLSSTSAISRIAIYSGTFDPLTLGHEDVARRASLLFDEVIIAVAMAHHKKTRFTLAERLEMAAEAAARMPGSVRVLPFDGLIMDFCRQKNASAVVRGIRNLTDFDYEAQMAAMNRKLNPAVETVFLLPQAELQCISSTLVREISYLNGDVSQMVSAAVAQRLLPKRLEA
ncbi:MAG: pantetheine-phosphate adenylyltransferase [Hydrogenophaga sp.]|uniref:pantetheine-phosphate adenylyltransferase n=1 Tax=Hydrogenophaga sp. TaxID=1904254 RepID=UPI002747D600|nr:pantetheine-phosphate adenylyltransferase [Hydrogenophaga sp.]MDP2417338.1 pantetheine-phosphate adenylyltransferase [Hydrogenophaga sp.]MDZ4189328.1 pantetheine-phosphate adenylyltransferase [Hydrogenophaga sp.]